jgi:hypothetical protein
MHSSNPSRQDSINIFQISLTQRELNRMNPLASQPPPEKFAFQRWDDHAKETGKLEETVYCRMLL